MWGHVYGLWLIIHVRATLDVGAKPKSSKSMLNLHGTILEGKSIGLNQKKSLKGELIICITKLKDSNLNLLGGPTQGFNR